MFTIDSLMTRLRRVNPFTYLVGIQLSIKTTPKQIIMAHEGGNILFSEDVLAGNCTEQYNVKAWNEPALTFILAHEINHIILGHCSPSPVHSRNYQISEYITWLAIETHCNWFTIQQLGYKFPDVVIPFDASQPTMIYADGYGFDPMGLHWTEIFDRLLQSGKIDPNTPMPSGTDYKVGKSSSAPDSDSIMDQAQLEAAIRRAGNMSTLPGALRHLEITEDKPTMPWNVLVARIHASAYESTGTWSKANRKALPLRGKGMKPKIYRLLLYIDTSGSVDEKTVNQIASALLSKPDVPIQINYLTFDTRIHGDKHKANAPFVLSSAKEKLILQGGGGTSFQTVADHWNTLKSKYDLAINITDGEDTLPSEYLSKYVWLIHGNKHFTASEPVFSLDA